MTDRMDRKTRIVSKFICEDDFKTAVVEFIPMQICDKARGGKAA